MNAKTFSLTPPARVLLFRTLVFAVVLSSALLSAFALRGNPWGFVRGEETLFIQDFADIFNYAKDFWQGNNPTPYAVEGHLAFMERWTGHPQEQAMPFGYSPTMLVLLLPLIGVPPAAAFLLWALIPFSVFALKMRTERGHQLLLAGVLTATAMSAVALGQTSPWAAWAALAVLSALTQSDKETLPRTLTLGLVVFLATAKPPIALALLFLLLFDKRWRALGVVSVLVLVEVAAFTVYLGPGWITDYLYLLTHYSRDTVPAALSPTLNPDTMSNFALVLHFFLGLSWSKAGMISNLLWLAGSLGTVAWGWLREQAGRHARLTTAFCLLWGFYFLFVSHLTITEDLLLLLPVWLCRQAGPKQWCLLLALSWIALNIGINKPLLPSLSGTLLLVALKILVLGLCLRHLRRHRSLGPPTPAIL